MGAVWAEKSARTLETPEGRRPERDPPSNLRNGREKPGFEAPGTGKSKAGEGVGSLGFRPSFRGRHSPANSPQYRCRHQIRKTNLSLQTISINSNSHNSAPNALPLSFESGGTPYRRPDSLSDLSGGVENQHLCINNHSQRGLPHYSLP